MPEFSPHMAHRALLEKAPRKLRFKPGVNFEAWRRELGDKFRELVGHLPERCPLNLQIISDTRQPGFREIAFVFTAEEHADVPCHLLIPANAKGPLPVVICLQGHTTGMHISLARAQYPGDEKSLGGDRDFALQAVKQGYAAIALEQRAFGQRNDSRPEPQRQGKPRCQHATMTALLLGRTMVGERVWDVMRAIDAVETLAADFQLDPKRVACMGNSGGGTITYYAAAMEPRIVAAMPSCVVCTYGSSLGSIDHCVDNYLPRALDYFDMGDIAGLIAPRPLIVVAGREDNIFPIAGVEEAYATISSIYEAAIAKDNCELITGPAGHRFYADLAWPIFRKLTGW
jgi:dienelactone hydrolase